MFFYYATLFYSFLSTWVEQTKSIAHWKSKFMAREILSVSTDLGWQTCFFSYFTYDRQSSVEGSNILGKSVQLWTRPCAGQTLRIFCLCRIQLQADEHCFLGYWRLSIVRHSAQTKTKLTTLYYGLRNIISDDLTPKKIKRLKENHKFCIVYQMVKVTSLVVY